MPGGHVTIDDTIIRKKSGVEGGNIKKTKSNDNLFELSQGTYSEDRALGRHETVIRRVSDADDADGSDLNTKHKKNKAGSLLNREALNDPNLVSIEQLVIHC